MNQRSNVAAIVSYLTWIGFIIALFIRDRNDDFTTHHMNQALILNIAEILIGVIRIFPLIGAPLAGICSIVIAALTILGIYRAVTWSMEPLPLIGNTRLI